MSMDNYIFISGAPLWVFLGIAIIFVIFFIVLGCAYIKECRENQYYKERCHKLCRELSILQLNAIDDDFKRWKANGDRSKE